MNHVDSWLINCTCGLWFQSWCHDEPPSFMYYDLWKQKPMSKVRIANEYEAMHTSSNIAEHAAEPCHEPWCKPQIELIAKAKIIHNMKSELISYYTVWKQGCNTQANGPWVGLQNTNHEWAFWTQHMIITAVGTHQNT